jgi:predicted CXXCH cytochrome family protein
MSRFAAFLIVLMACVAAASQSSDVLGDHDLSSLGSTVRGGNAAACLYCHAPHSGNNQAGPLWNQRLSAQTYTLYTSKTLQNTTTQPTVGSTSTLCLSCHDGTVAPGQMTQYGPIDISAQMTDVWKSSLQTSHPFSLNLPLADSSNLIDSLKSTGATADQTGSVRLIKGNVECTSCHSPHNQFIDKKAPQFLVRDNTSGGLCFSCHYNGDRTVNGIPNPLSQWTASIHATSPAQVKAATGVPDYSTVSEAACGSCHHSHSSGAGTPLLRDPASPPAGVDTFSQSCIACHSGAVSLVQPILNVFAKMGSGGHPYPSSSSTAHDTAEPAILVNNRHATCADCHDAHSSKATSSFADAPNVRPSQNGARGVAVDGTALQAPATMQYQTCLRCHGPGAGKQALSTYGYLPVRAVSAADPLNLIPQFDMSTVSAHPVMRDRSPVPPPSLLQFMWNLTATAPARVIGTRILCTDCHNAEDNREFGGAGANGPHGSRNWHILERRYEFSQVAPGTNFPFTGPGSPIQNVFVNPDLTTSGPYAMCGKCHDLSNVLSDASFKPGPTGKGGHFTHISEQGASCSVCHTPHGMGSFSANIQGDRMVNFDVNAVAPNGTAPISYSRVSNTCVLACHGYSHNTNGSVTAIPLPLKAAQVIQ